jgi:tetratricopeptide (TPR) repeat protein
MNARFKGSTATLLALLLVGCGGDPGAEQGDSSADTRSADPGPGSPGWQATSLLGEELFQLEDTTGAIAAADAELAATPDDVELIIAAARVRRNFWQYRQAMELYTRAAELAPDDWRPYRFRGHRHISVREYANAVRDLEAARDRAPLNWDVAYHLGLAYFLAGDFDAAADEYVRCLELADDADARAADSDDFRSCSANADDPESLVAMTEWAVRALERAGRPAEAQALLDGIPSDLPIEENLAYYHDLLFYKGELTEETLLGVGPDGPYRFETVAQGVANRRLVQGDTAGAVELYERIMDDPWWPGFGRIAAETELARLR